jgi:hypothetical protein
MPLGKINHVNVVSNASSVGSIVIVSINRELVSSSDTDCAMKGIKLLGMPCGSSTASPEGCGPYGNICTRSEYPTLDGQNKSVHLDIPV